MARCRRLITQVAFNNNRVEFITSGSQGFGNAVIAVYDNVDPNANDAKVLWSWHIWCAPRPSDRYIHSESGGTIYTFMDRNIGAVSDTGGDNSYGLYYQWGRKDPFKKPGAPLFNVLGMKVSALHELKQVSLSEGIQNPLSFFSKGTDMRTAWSPFSHIDGKIVVVQWINLYMTLVPMGIGCLLIMFFII